MSRAPRLLLELREILLVMVGEMTHDITVFYSSKNSAIGTDILGSSKNYILTFIEMLRTAENCKELFSARSITLLKLISKNLARENVERIKF